MKSPKALKTPPPLSRKNSATEAAKGVLVDSLTDSDYDERVDELIKAGETEADQAQRQAIYDEAQQIVYDEAPAVFLILPGVAEASSDRVENWEPASDSRINLHDVSLK